MNKHSTVFIGMDTHKENTIVGICKDKRSDKPELFGTIKTRTVAIAKMVRQLQSKYPNSTLIFVYEAGPAVIGSIAYSLSLVSNAISWPHPWCLKTRRTR